MSNTAASSTNEPPRTNNEHPQSPPSFSSLPDDIVLNVLARVPRRYHPILSCVSKNFRSLVRSSELRKTRTLQGKDSFYVCFKERDAPSLTYHWFTLTENRLVSIRFPSQPKQCSAAIMVGPEIYFVGGYYKHPSRDMWILDSRSGKLRQGPSMRVARRFTAVGLVDEKIYAFGGVYEEGDEENKAEVFDPKTQTWEVAPISNLERSCLWMSVVSPSLDRKVYVRKAAQVIVYDPRDDGKCEKIDIPNDHSCSQDVCVIENMLYIYCSYVGLMWYDSSVKDWRLVKGLKMDEYSALNVTMGEFNGKLVFLRNSFSLEEEKKKEIWCAMIALDRNGVEISGNVEWFVRLLSVPCDYMIMHCLGRTD